MKEKAVTEKTVTETRYAGFRQSRDGSWYKIHPFYARSKVEAEYYIEEWKRSACYPPNEKFKVMKRTVTTTTISTEWEDTEND